MTRLRARWMGDLPHGDAVRTRLVFGGFLVNIATSVALPALIAADLPWVAPGRGQGLSSPNVSGAPGGVRRSAARHEGRRAEPELARAASATLIAS